VKVEHHSWEAQEKETLDMQTESWSQTPEGHCNIKHSKHLIHSYGIFQQYSVPKTKQKLQQFNKSLNACTSVNVTNITA